MKGEMCKLMIEARYLNAKKKIERKKLSNETTVKKKENAMLHTFWHTLDPNIIMTAKRPQEVKSQNILLTRVTYLSSSGKLIAL